MESNEAYIRSLGGQLVVTRERLKEAVEEIRGKLQGRHGGLEAEAQVLVSQDYAHVEVLLEEFQFLVSTLTNLVIDEGWHQMGIGTFRRKFAAYHWISSEELLSAAYLAIRLKAVPFWNPDRGPLKARVVSVVIEKLREHAGAGGDGGAVSVPRAVAEADTGYNRATRYLEDNPHGDQLRATLPSAFAEGGFASDLEMVDWVSSLHAQRVNQEDAVIGLLDAKRQHEREGEDRE